MARWTLQKTPKTRASIADWTLWTLPGGDKAPNTEMEGTNG